MIKIAIKMLIGHKASFLGVIFGIFLATLLISQQSAIFLGLVSRSYRVVTDIPSPDIWVVDPATQSEDMARGIPESYADVVRSVPGIEWAVPISMVYMPLVTQSGIFHVCQLYGIDDATLIGAPTQMIEGSVKDLRRPGGVIVDVYAAKDSLAKILPDGTKEPLKVGDEMEINNHRAVIVGICKITQGFYPQAIIFATNSEFHIFNPTTENRAGFIAAKTTRGANLAEVTKNIHMRTGLDALSRDQFKSRIIDFFLKTGILINFGLSVTLGMIIGFLIAGQVFYIMTLENLMYYALIKAVGGTKKMILHMIMIQATVVGIIGFSLGICATIFWGMAMKDTTLAFLFPWQLLLFTGFLVLIICIFTAGLSIRKVFHVDPKVLLGN